MTDDLPTPPEVLRNAIVRVEQLLARVEGGRAVGPDGSDPADPDVVLERAQRYSAALHDEARRRASALLRAASHEAVEIVSAAHETAGPDATRRQERHAIESAAWRQDRERTRALARDLTAALDHAYPAAGRPLGLRFGAVRDPG